MVLRCRARADRPLQRLHFYHEGRAVRYFRAGANYTVTQARAGDSGHYQCSGTMRVPAETESVPLFSAKVAVRVQGAGRRSRACALGLRAGCRAGVPSLPRSREREGPRVPRSVRFRPQSCSRRRCCGSRAGAPQEAWCCAVTRALTRTSARCRCSLLSTSIAAPCAPSTGHPSTWCPRPTLRSWTLSGVRRPPPPAACANAAPGCRCPMRVSAASSLSPLSPT